VDQLACPIEGAVAPHQLVHGDCVPVMAEMAPETIDVAVTSPPYNLGLTYRQYRDRRGEEEYLDWMVRVAEAVRRVLKPGGSFFLNISGSSSQPWLPFELIVRLRPVFVLQNHITWIKSIAAGDT
jgi:site-specific DNA-methyltransferase (adenine-specific)